MVVEPSEETTVRVEPAPPPAPTTDGAPGPPATGRYRRPAYNQTLAEGLKTSKACRDFVKGLPFKYTFLHGTGSYRVLRCAEHASCPARVRYKFHEGKGCFVVEQSDDAHSQEARPQTPRGIPWGHRMELKAKLSAGQGPKVRILSDPYFIVT